MTEDELKKEAEKWLCNNLHSASEEDFIKAMVEFAEPREKRIAELEKENVELKEELKEYKNGNFVQTVNQIIEGKDKQLTKAKEIIRSLYFVIQDRIDYKGNIPLEDEMYRAKQFLK